jgi:uncharacterized membrane protein YhaH (DUF805 family)
MVCLLSFRGKVARLPYARWSLAAFFSQYLIILVLAREFPGANDPWTYAAPLWLLESVGAESAVLHAVGGGYMLLVAWILAALACRRALDAGIHQAAAVVAVMPVLQIPAILYLCIVPSPAAPGHPAAVQSHLGRP